MMTVDKAYILGLVIGGGIFGSNQESFHIKLPYKQWGSLEINPRRAGSIARDIIGVVKPMISLVYGLDVTYDVSDKSWDVICSGDLSQLKNDLNRYGIAARGELRKNATIESVVCDLDDDNLKRRFIAGLADTIGSTTKSHRRFFDDIQIISFEINGFRFDFVCQLCRLLYSVKCYPDQILWNHPNFHSGNDPYYSSWKKGFKLRVQLDQYSKFGAFCFRTKAESATENRELQNHTNVASPCENRPIAVTKACVHMDENSPLLPDEIRGGHYLHNKHVCAVLGCPHAPYDELQPIINNAGKYVNPFPILKKGTLTEMLDTLENNPVLKNRKYTKRSVSVQQLYNQFNNNVGCRLFGDEDSGYPINYIIQAVTYLIAAKKGILNGKRPRGNQNEIIESYLSGNEKFDIQIMVPDKLSAAILTCDHYAAMVGADNEKVYSKLIVKDSSNPYKINVREITEDDYNA